MTFKEYVEMCQKKLVEHPEWADLKAIYAVDEEGNSYREVHWGPTVGHADGVEYLDFRQYGDLDEDEAPRPSNAICIN